MPRAALVLWVTTLSRKPVGMEAQGEPVSFSAQSSAPFCLAFCVVWLLWSASSLNGGVSDLPRVLLRPLVVKCAS